MEHLADDLGDQVVFAGEVVADHTLADAEPYRDTRERGVRVPNFASLPPLAIIALIQFKVITPSTGLALALAAVLLIVDALGWRAVAAIFDRERLITGRRR